MVAVEVVIHDFLAEKRYIRGYQSELQQYFLWCVLEYQQEIRIEDLKHLFWEK